MDNEQRAERAYNILNDNLFKEALSVVKEYHMERMLAESAGKKEVLEARRMVLALEAVTSQLEGVILTGEMEKGRHRE